MPPGGHRGLVVSRRPQTVGMSSREIRGAVSPRLVNFACQILTYRVFLTLGRPEDHGQDPPGWGSTASCTVFPGHPSRMILVEAADRHHGRAVHCGGRPISGRLVRSGSMPGEHVFVDETKSGGLVVVAVATSSARVDMGRVAMRRLLQGSQRHLHFTKERDSRRKQIIREIVQLNVAIDVYDASKCDPRKARDLAMEMIVADLAAAQAVWLNIEMDESLAAAERKVLAAAVRRHGVEGELQYRHVPKRDEPMLWVADAAAWCWTHPGWKERISPKIRDVKDVL